jgi:membrane protease YdiL (CAAX protease family)
MRSSADPASENYRFAAKLRGFGLVGIAAILVILAGNFLFAPLSAILVLLWRWRARVAWSDIGFSRPRSWFVTIALGFAIGIALRFVMKALVMPLLGAPAANPAYHFIAHNPQVLPGMILTMIFVAGFGEEILYRGYIFERLRRLLGNGRGASIAILALTSALFAAAHIHEQGLAGAEQSMITGLVFGTIYLLTGSLWMSIVAHATFDLAAVAIIYLGVEVPVAHALLG